MESLPSNGAIETSDDAPKIDDLGLPSAEFKRTMLDALPSLRAFAVSLIGSQDRADDLVQDAIMNAWAKHHSFQPGTNMKAWLITILRNGFYSQMRKANREVQDSDGAMIERLSVHPAQYGQMEMRDFANSLAELPDDQREAIILVGASGFSYEEAAEICGCAIGTIKSRVNRARVRLQEAMQASEGAAAFGPDATVAAVISR